MLKSEVKTQAMVRLTHTIALSHYMLRVKIVYCAVSFTDRSEPLRDLLREYDVIHFEIPLRKRKMLQSSYYKVNHTNDGIL